MTAAFDLPLQEEASVGRTDNSTTTTINNQQ
jgi:hypothetical protein